MITTLVTHIVSEFSFILRTCWKNEMSGHKRRTSLSICSKNSLSLKNVLQALSGPSLSGWSAHWLSLLLHGGCAISSAKIYGKMFYNKKNLSRIKSSNYLWIVDTVPVSSSIHRSNQPVLESNIRIIVSNILNDIRLYLVCLRTVMVNNVIRIGHPQFAYVPLKHNFRSLSKHISSLPRRSSNAFTLEMVSICIAINNLLNIFMLCLPCFVQWHIWTETKDFMMFTSERGIIVCVW